VADKAKQPAKRDEAPATGAKPAAGATPGSAPGSLRRWLVGALVVVFALGLLITATTTWLHRTLLNTDQYVQTVAPIIKDPEVTQALSEYLAQQLITAVDMQQRTEDALPPKASFLAAPVTQATQDFIAKETDKMLQTDQAYNAWVKINTVVHEKLVGLLRGDNKYTYISGDSVYINTIPLITQVIAWIESRLPGALGDRLNLAEIAAISPDTPPDEAIAQLSTAINRQLPEDFGQITLAKSDRIAQAQRTVRIFDAVTVLLWVFCVILLAVILWLSPNRRRTLLQLGIAVVVALVAVRVISNQLQERLYADLAQTDSLGSNVAGDTIRAALGSLRGWATWFLVGGIVVAVAAYLAGKPRWAGSAVNTTGRFVTQGTERLKVGVPASAWAAEHVDGLRLAGVVAMLVVLLFITSSGTAIIVTLVLLVLYELLVSWLAALWPFHGHTVTVVPSGSNK
jgi:hypothetical protein